MLEDIVVHPNAKSLVLQFEHVDGGLVNLLIQRNHACYDNDKRLRLFTAVWDDGDIQMYKLLPINGKYHPVVLIGAFIAGLAGGVAAKKLIEKIDAPKYALPLSLGSFFAVPELRRKITSVTTDIFSSHDVGYFNVTTKKLILKARYKGHSCPSNASIY